MTIEQLVNFVTIVEHHTYFEASVLLHISQSSLSKSIQKLELEIGTLLFDRSKRTVSLTSAGKQFYTDAKIVIAAHDTMLQHISPFSDTHQNSLKIATLPFLSQYRLTTKINDFAAKHPSVAITLDEMEETRLLLELASGSYDMGMIRSECLPENMSSVRTYPIDRDSLVLLVPCTHPLARCSSVSLAQLAREKFIFMHPHTSIYHTCMRACHEAGFTPAVIRTARIESIISAVSSNEGISLLMSKNGETFNHSKVALVPLTEHIASSIVVAVPKQTKLSPLIKAFIEAISNLSCISSETLYVLLVLYIFYLPVNFL